MTQKYKLKEAARQFFSKDWGHQINTEEWWRGQVIVDILRHRGFETASVEQYY